MPGALDGVRILDFTQGLAGPMACMLLADLVADVIKIEPPTGDRLADQPGYLCWNRNKRRIALDLEKQTDLGAVRELLATADAAVFDDSLEGRERLGLDAAALHQHHPTLLCCELPHWGAPGWWSDLPVDDTLLWGLGGGAFAQFSWEDVPVQLVTPQLGYAHAMLAAGVIAAGLYERERSGLGQRIEVSGVHALASIQSGTALRANDPNRRRALGARGVAPHYKLYQCADGEWLFLATLMPHHFAKALEALDLRDVWEIEGVEGQFANIMLPGVARHVRARLEERFAARTRAESLRALHEAGVPSGPVGGREAWFAGETVAANGMRVVLDHAELGTVELPGVPLRLGETPTSLRHLVRSATLSELLEPRSDRLAGYGQSPPLLEVLPGSGGQARLPAARAGVRLEPAPSLKPRTGPDGRGPLAGIRVLDLGVIIASPFASAILANLGADVIKVEPPSGDAFRRYGLGFVGYNQGKRSIALDLKRPEGLRAFRDLVREVDVICDNYRPGVLERLGIDYATLSRINPRLVQASVTAYGCEGAASGNPGFDPLLQAEAGLMQAQGGDDEPVFHQVAINDTASAMVTVLGIVAALRAREHSGRGQRVETSLASQSVLCQSGELVRYAGCPPRPRGGRDCLGLSALQRFYACADGWLGIAAADPAQLRGLLEALGHPEWADRPFGAASTEPWDGELAERLAAAIATRPRQALLAELRERGVPAAPATPVEGLHTSPLHLANRFFEQVEHPEFGSLMGVRSFAEFERTPGGFVRRAPLLGEHDAEVLTQLGFRAERIARLRADGVLGGALPASPKDG